MVILTRPSRILLVMLAGVLTSFIGTVLISRLMPPYEPWMAVPMLIACFAFYFVVGLIWEYPSWPKYIRNALVQVPLIMAIGGLCWLLIGRAAGKTSPHRYLDQSAFFASLYVPFFFGRLVSRFYSQH